MNISSLIAQHIIDVHEGNNWTEVNLISTLDGISYEDASQVTPASVNTIAGLVKHLTFWSEVMVHRIEGQDLAIPDSNGYDNLPLDNAETWERLIKSCLMWGRRLAEAVANVPETRLQEPIITGASSTYKNLQGTAEHIHYHLGQIVILKQLLRAMQ